MSRRFLTRRPNADVFTSMALNELQGQSGVAVMLPTSKPKATIAITSCVKRAVHDVASERVDRMKKHREQQQQQQQQQLIKPTVFLEQASNQQA